MYPFVLHDNKHKPIKYQRVMEEANLANMLRWLRQNNEESKPIDKSIYFSFLSFQPTISATASCNNEKSSFQFLDTIDPRGIDKRL